MEWVTAIVALLVGVLALVGVLVTNSWTKRQQEAVAQAIALAKELKSYTPDVGNKCKTEAAELVDWALERSKEIRSPLAGPLLKIRTVCLTAAIVGGLCVPAVAIVVQTPAGGGEGVTTWAEWGLLWGIIVGWCAAVGYVITRFIKP